MGGKGGGTTRKGSADNPKGLAIQKTPIIAAAPMNHRVIYSISAQQVGTHHFNNGLEGDYEITNNDLRNIISESGKDKNIRDIRGALIPRIKEVVENGEYVGWSPDDGSHPGVAYFTYYSKTIGRKVYLAMRYMKTEKRYKPYTFYSEQNFKKYRAPKIKKGIPTI